LGQWIDQNFKAEGLEHRWAPLAQSTLFGRRMGGKGAKILQNNGMLRASHTYRASTDRVVVGFPEGSVAEYHHFGTRPYIIRPKKAGGVLMFFMPLGAGGSTSIIRRKAGTPRVGMVKGGKQSVMFRREVHHPGLKARPLLPSLSLADTLVQKIAQNYIERLLK